MSFQRKTRRYFREPLTRRTQRTELRFGYCFASPRVSAAGNPETARPFCSQVVPSSQSLAAGFRARSWQSGTLLGPFPGL